MSMESITSADSTADSAASTTARIVDSSGAFLVKISGNKTM